MRAEAGVEGKGALVSVMLQALGQFFSWQRRGGGNKRRAQEKAESMKESRYKGRRVLLLLFTFKYTLGRLR